MYSFSFIVYYNNTPFTTVQVKCWLFASRKLNRDAEKYNYADVNGEEDENEFEAKFDGSEYVEAGPRYDDAKMVRRSADPYIILPSGDGMYGEPLVLVG